MTHQKLSTATEHISRLEHINEHHQIITTALESISATAHRFH